MKKTIPISRITLLSLTSLLATGLSHAAVIAVVDSGTDLDHKELVAHQWTNSGETAGDAQDNDQNGFVDDIHGWNFAEGNDQLFDKKFLGTFKPDTYKFFEIQGRILRGKQTADDIAWMKSKKGDEAFIKELGTFGNFVHGTHVAGITAKDSPGAQVMGIKLIPTESPLQFKKGLRLALETRGIRAQSLNALPNGVFDDYLVQMGLSYLAQQQATALAPIGDYLANKGAQVTNCSFGIGYPNAKTLIANLIKQVLGKDPSPEDLDKYAKFFVGEVAKNMKGALVDKSPKNLFVIAAGNDGSNNDVEPTAPANIKSDNSISVAATMDRSALAVFSSYGEKMVEVAAPGVTIRSSIPGNEYLEVSGTSQAAPFVANVAGAVLDADNSLTPAQIKQVIMATVDVKDFLKGKVMTSGIVNPTRAVLAASLVKTLGMDEAIKSAKEKIADIMDVPATPVATDLSLLYVLPLTQIFK